MVVMHACQRRWRQPIKAKIKRMRGGRPRKPINKVMMVAKEDEDGDKNNEDDEGEENREREREN